MGAESEAFHETLAELGLFDGLDAPVAGHRTCAGAAAVG